MSKEIVFLTGLNGSGASYIAEYLINNQPHVEVHGGIRWHSSSNMNNLSNIKNKIIIHEMDLLDPPSIVRILDKIKPDKIMHLAAHANVSVSFKTPLSVINNNIMSTANLLESIRMVCPNTTLLIASTSEVYGNPKTYPIKEDFPVNPMNPYSVSKLASEQLAVSYFHSYGIKVIVTRAFSYINPRRHDLVATAFAMQIARIEAGQQECLYHGFLESIRAFIDVRDIAEAYWIASEKCEPGTPYHIGGGQPYLVGMLISIMKYKINRPFVCVEDKKLLRPVDVFAQVPDTTKFYEATGWKPKYTLDESLTWLLNECREYVKKEIK